MDSFFKTVRLSPRFAADAALLSLLEALKALSTPELRALYVRSLYVLPPFPEEQDRVDGAEAFFEKWGAGALRQDIGAYATHVLATRA